MTENICGDRIYCVESNIYSYNRTRIEELACGYPDLYEYDESSDNLQWRLVVKVRCAHGGCLTRNLKTITKYQKRSK